MKKISVTLVAILIVSVLVVSCREMETVVNDSSEQVQRHESSSSQEKTSESIETEPNTRVSPSLGISFDELISDLTESGYKKVESLGTETEFPSSLEECILGPTGTGYKVVESPRTEIEFPSSLEDVILGPTGTGYK